MMFVVQRAIEAREIVVQGLSLFGSILVLCSLLVVEEWYQLVVLAKERGSVCVKMDFIYLAKFLFYIVSVVLRSSIDLWSWCAKSY